MVVVADTTFLVDLGRGHAGAVALLRRLHEDGQAILTPTLAVAEYLAGSKAPAEDLASILAAMQVQDFTLDDALAGAQLAREGFAEGDFPGWMDALIAGFARHRGGAAVVTRNPKHFPRVQTLSY